MASPLDFGGAPTVVPNPIGDGTVSASTAYPGWPAAALFDTIIGESPNAWSADNNGPAWVQYLYPSATTIDRYRVVARPGAPNSCASAWTFEGSNNGTSWTVLDTQTGQTWTASQSREYTIASPAAYTHYRMNITATQGGGATWPSFAEWTLYNGTVSLPALADWYSADAITGTAIDATVAAGNIVDGSGNGHTFTGYTWSSGAPLRTGGYNGRRWVDHGANPTGYLGPPSLLAMPSGDVTFFGIIKVNTTGSNQTIISGGPSAPSLRMDTSNRLVVLKDNVAGVGSSTLTLTNGTWTPFIVTYTQSTGSMTFQIGASSETVSGTAGTTFSQTVTRTIGDRDNVLHELWGGGAGTGWVELGRYHVALNSTDRTGLMSYLTTATGLPPGSFTDYATATDSVVAAYDNKRPADTAAATDAVSVELLLAPTGTPSTLAGNVLWLRAKDLETTPLRWADRSGLGNHAGLLDSLTNFTKVTGATPAGGPVARLAAGDCYIPRLPLKYGTIAASASSHWNPSTNPVDLLNDGLTTNEWVAGSSALPQWVQYQVMAGPTVVTQYSLRATAGNTGNAPGAWQFQGSNDGENWTTLDTRSGQTPLNSPASVYSFSNSTAYRFYRLHITARAGGGNEARFVELSLTGVASAAAVAGPAEFWAVIKSNDTSGNWMHMGVGGAQNHYTFSGTVYEDFGATVRDSFAPTMSVSSTYRLLRITMNSSGTKTWELDGVSQGSVTGRTLNWQQGPMSLANSWSGDYAEVLVRDRLSTTDERTALMAYFKAEHGLAYAVAGVVTLADTAVGNDIVDTAAGGVDRTANIDDNAIGVDSGVGSIAAGEYINDHAVALDSLVEVDNIIVDTAAATDVVTKVGDKRVTLADSATATDSVQVDEKRVFIADNATATDSIRATEAFIADAATATDSVVTRSGVNDLADTATITDAITAEQPGRINDFATATDNVVADFRPGCRISLEKSRHLVPWHSTAETIDLPFGEAQGIPLADGTYVATVNMEPDVALNWYLRVFKLDASLAITGYVDVPTNMDSFSATSVLIEDYKIRVLCSRMSVITSRTHEVVDLDVSGGTPVVLAHSTNAPGGVGSSSYSAGISANYIPGDDLACYGYYQFGVFKGSVWMGESGPYPPASYYTHWGYDPTAANPRRFVYVVHKGGTPGDPTKMDIEVGETSVTPAGIASHTLLYTVSVPDGYWIRPIHLVGDQITVLERLEGTTVELGWQVAVYNLTTGVRVTVLSLVAETTGFEQYLAMNPSVHFDGLGNLMVFADMGPDWGTSADWGAGTLHPGFERQVLYYSAGGQHLAMVKAPRPTTDGHGEMDSLASRSTAGWFNPTTGAWAMASTMTDLYEAGPGSYYATDFWAGFLYCGGGGGIGGGGGSGGSGSPTPTLDDPAMAIDALSAVWHLPPLPVPPSGPTYVTAGVGTLGCGNSTAAVYERGGVNRLFVIDQLTSIEYSRVRDDMSDALLHIPTTAECCQDLSLIEPVRHELVIFRDNIRVWEGPITRLGFSNDDIELAAKDVLFWAYRTIMRSAYDNSYPNTGYGTDRIGLIMRSEMVRKEQQDPPINVLPYLQVHTTEDTARTARVTKPYQKTVFEEMDDMAAKAGLDFTTVGRSIHVHDTEYVLGQTTLASEADFLGGVIVSMYGMDLATYSAVTDGEGNFGSASADMAYYGEVEMLETAYDENPNDNTDPEAPAISVAELTSQAKRNQSGRFPVPVEVRVPDNSQLNPNSQVFTFDMLVPGVKVPLMALSGCKRLRQDQKIDSVTVRQDENGEVVTMTLVPFPKSQVTGLPTSASSEPGTAPQIRIEPPEVID